MPRKSRIDAPGALHHIIGRGIARGAVFLGDADRDDFLNRLGELATATNTSCYAWALIPNHFHLLLRTKSMPLSSLMKRLLTGYAVCFNLKHGRTGHLFQNRYKSILCEEEPYMLELVRYIHLNPLRAGLVNGYEELSRYPYSGHSAILGYKNREWQDVEYVLGAFGCNLGEARRKYKSFVKQGIKQGSRPDLVGGGLLRSQGGWAGLKALREAGDYQKGDERILGNGAFVERTLAAAEENYERRHRLRSKGYDIDRVAKFISGLLGITQEEVMRPGRVRGRLGAKARSLLCYWATMELGMKQSRLADVLHLTQPAISVAAKRGAEVIKESGYSLKE